MAPYHKEKIYIYNQLTICECKNCVTFRSNHYKPLKTVYRTMYISNDGFISLRKHPVNKNYYKHWQPVSVFYIWGFFLLVHIIPTYFIGFLAYGNIYYYTQHTHTHKVGYFRWFYDLYRVGPPTFNKKNEPNNVLYSPAFAEQGKWFVIFNVHKLLLLALAYTSAAWNFRKGDSIFHCYYTLWILADGIWANYIQNRCIYLSGVHIQFTHFSPG